MALRIGKVGDGVLGVGVGVGEVGVGAVGRRLAAHRPKGDHRQYSKMRMSYV